MVLQTLKELNEDKLPLLKKTENWLEWSYIMSDKMLKALSLKFPGQLIRPKKGKEERLSILMDKKSILIILWIGRNGIKTASNFGKTELRKLRTTYE